MDPIHAIEEYGCDALRSALVQGTSAGQDVLLDMERVKLQRSPLFSLSPNCSPFHQKLRQQTLECWEVSATLPQQPIRGGTL